MENISLKQIMKQDFDPEMAVKIELVNSKLRSIDSGYALAGMIVSKGLTGRLTDDSKVSADEVAIFTTALARKLGKHMADDYEFFINAYTQKEAEHDKIAELPLVS